MGGTNNQNGAFKQSYNRNIPTVFDGDSAAGDVLDQYTQKLISDHALEGVDKKKGKAKGDEMRTNHFYLEKSKARELSIEILGTHFGKNAADAGAWLDAGHFEDAWNYWDVLGAGNVDAVGSSTFNERWRFCIKENPEKRESLSIYSSSVLQIF